MTIAFACALSHAPGIVAWRDAAPAAQQEKIYASFSHLPDELRAARADKMILFTSEHWANFFLDHISPFCIGRAARFSGPIEPWLKIEKVTIDGDPDLAQLVTPTISSLDTPIRCNSTMVR